MSRRLATIALIWCCSVLVWGGASPRPAAVAQTPSGPLTSLPGHTLEQVLQGTATAAAPGALPANPTIALTVILNRTDPSGFQSYLAAVQNPASPGYHHFLSQPALAAQFGPSQPAYDAVSSYLQGQGLTVIEGSVNRLTLTVQGSRSQVAQALHVQIRDFQLSGRAFYANTSDPSVPSAIAPFIQAVSGLDNLAVGVPGLLPQQPGAVRSFLQPTPTPMALAAAYNFSGVKTQTGQAATGIGQRIGLMEFDDFYNTDLSNWLILVGLPASLSSQVSRRPVLGGTTPSNTSGTAEVQLDLEAVVGMAQGATFKVYETPNTAFTTQVPAQLNAMLSDGITVVTNSWSSCEDQTTVAALQAIDAVLAQAAAGGVPVFNDTGDNGNDCQVDLPAHFHHASFPSDSPNGFGVGATSLQVTAGGVYQSEAWWDWGTDPLGAGGFGVSRVFARPAYQNGLTPSAFRSVPDISADGDPNTGINICVEVLGNAYSCTGGRTGALFGGTSLSTPEWAAGAAVLQQVLGPLGNFVPLLYATFSAGGSKGFHTTASMLPSARGPTNDFAHLGLGSFDLPSLSAALSAATPTFTCSAAAPVVATLDTCTTSLNGPLPAGTTLLAQAGGPPGASVAACSATGGLICGAVSPTGQSLSCSNPCPIGAGFSLQFSSPSSGPISETLTINAPGAPQQVLTLTPNPPASFVAPGTPAGATNISSAGGPNPTVTSGGVTATASGGIGTLTVFQYTGNPGPAPSFNAIGTFFDIRLTAGSTYTTLNITVCGLNAGATLYWLNSANAWQAATPVSDGANGCIVLNLSATSSPTLGQLVGTVFALAATPPVPPVAAVDTSIAASYCAPAVNAAPPGVPCMPVSPTVQQSLAFCTATYGLIYAQQGCIASVLGNVGGFISPFGNSAPPSPPRKAPKTPPGRYCTDASGAMDWVPVGAPVPDGFTC